MEFRFAVDDDLNRLAVWNRELIEDQGHRNRMTVDELRERMRGWLGGEYTGVIFSVEGADVAYGLYRESEDEIHLRHLFVRRDRRRMGIGRKAVAILRDQIWRGDKRLTVEALTANTGAVDFWRSMGYEDYSLALEITPEEDRGDSGTVVESGAADVFEVVVDGDLEIRLLREQDAEELLHVVAANRNRLREWLPWVDGTTEVEHTQKFLRGMLEQHARGEGTVWGIMLAGRIVGVVGFHKIQRTNRSVEIGYWLSEEAEGRGIMTKCCRALVNHAFGELGLNRVAIFAAEGNARSRAVPERLGFKQEGVVRDAEWLYDHYVDHVMYGALKREWDSASEYRSVT